MTWILFGWAVLVAVATLNALWPVRRPWWLKLPSFNAGWFANELPVHLLAGHVVAVAVLALRGGPDGRPGQVGLALSVPAAVGLIVLAAAHRRARSAMDEALSETIADDGAGAGRSLPWSWLVWPWLAWLRAPGVERVAGVVYSSVPGRDLSLDIYAPVGHRNGCPVLVEIHSGGWIMGDRRVDARPLMTHMVSRGWVCVSVDYRVGRAATWPEQIIDVNAALAWVREHVAEYGGDPDFVAVTGGSAGGHLAALATLAPHDVDYQPPSGRAAEIRACVPFYGAYDFNNSLGLRPAREMRMVERLVVKESMANDPTRFERAAPLARVQAEAPAFLVVQGTSDNLVFPAEARAFVDRLRATSRTEVAYAEVPRAHHAFDVVASVRTRHVIRGVGRFLSHVHSNHLPGDVEPPAPAPVEPVG